MTKTMISLCNGQTGLGLRLWHILESTFSHGVVSIIRVNTNWTGQNSLKVL